MKRLALALLPLLAVLLLPRTAVADDQPFKTVVDTIVPKTAGLTIEGSTGGCDLLLQNQTGQDVVLFDTSKPPKPLRFAAKPKSASPPPPVPVHLTGAWPCASLPAVTEDHSWNHAEVTVGSWSLLGTVGAISFKLTARTLYDPALDPSAEWSLYLRLAIGAALVGGLLIAVPYLVRRRLEILGNSKKAR